MGLMEQVHVALEAFGVDDTTTNQVLAMLEQSEDALSQGRVRTSAEGAFGSSHAGATLSWDAGVAHAKVAQAMADMVAGLGGYAESLRAFRADATRTDDEVAGAMTSLQAATDRLSTPTVAAASDRGTTGAGTDS